MIDREAVLRVLHCSPSQYPQMLSEKFPHVLEKIVQLWDEPEVVAYFVDLLQPNGCGGGRFDRDGFPDQAWQEILQLQILHGRTRPK